MRLFGRGRAEVAASVALNHGVGRKQGRLAGFGRSGLRSSRFHTIGLKPGLFEEIRGVIWTSSSLYLDVAMPTVAVVTCARGRCHTRLNWNSIFSTALVRLTGTAEMEVMWVDEF